MIRNSVAAGQFYPGSASEIEELIKTLVDKRAPKEDVVGLIAPHAGYTYSGPVAGAVFSQVKFPGIDTAIIIGPNHTGRGKPFSLFTTGAWETPMGEVDVDSQLASRILTFSRYLRDDFVAHQYEHAIEVQLPFLQYFKRDIKIVPIALTDAPKPIFKEIGKELARAIKGSGKEVIILASSDMDHYEAGEVTRQKDRQAIEAILDMDPDKLGKRVDEFNITMCGYGPAMVMMAAAKELGGTWAELVKYQTSGDITGDHASVVGYAGIIVKKMSPIVKLAKDTVENYVTEGKTISPPPALPPEMQAKAGVFVSIHKLGELRGCIGTFEPTQENVAEEIIANAVSSATRDPRFVPVSKMELKDLDYSVDVLTKPEPVDSIEQLDPRKYGAIVECGWRKGLLLPDLEGVDSAEMQVHICCEKAGIPVYEANKKLYRFEVKRYK